jgi:4-amino-4-deoxy-L-arabinose transferase-like glycosyltransferase
MRPVNFPRPGSVTEPAAVKWLLPGFVLLALVVRVVWAAGHGLSIEMEGAEYARIAENLLAGKGYVGMFNNGTQLNFPPLYPLMIAAVSLVTGSAEVAARAINIVLGTALVVPVFKLAELIHGRRVAVVAAALAAFHPVLIAGSASTYAEATYLPFMLFALFFLVRWAIDRRLSSSIAAGALLGIAYLIRPEAFLLAGLFGAAGLIASAFVVERRRTIVGSLALLGAFVVVAAPNIAFLTYHTGQLRIEAKGTLAYQWGHKINQGMSYSESVAGIGPDLSDQGVFLRPNLEVIRSTSYTPKEYAEFVARAAKRNVAPILRTVTGDASFGSPFLFALVVLGVFGSAWSRRRLLLDGCLVAYALMFALVLLTVQELWFRYFYAMLGMLLFWAAKGADELGAWGEATAQAVVDSATIARRTGTALKWLAILLVLGVSARYIPSVEQFEESQKPARKAAGQWLARQVPAPARVMGFDLQVPFYAGSDLILLPYADSALALSYIAKRNPNYIVLIGGSPGGLPYTTKWFSDGIPSPNASLVYDEAKPGSERIKIYRWLPPSATAAN